MVDGKPAGEKTYGKAKGQAADWYGEYGDPGDEGKGTKGWLDNCVSDAWSHGCLQNKDQAQTQFDKQPKQISEPILNVRQLTPDDVKGLTPEANALLRNYMYAQYGRNFDSPAYGKFFQLMGSQPYADKADNEKIDAAMSDIQRNNAKFLLGQERRPIPDLGPSQADIKEMPRRMGEPVMNQRALTEDDLSGLSPTMLNVLRNSVFAQYGYHFVIKPEIGQFFKTIGEREAPLASDNATSNPVQQSMSQLEAIHLTPIQQFNVQFLADHEKALLAQTPKQ